MRLEANIFFLYKMITKIYIVSGFATRMCVHLVQCVHSRKKKTEMPAATRRGGAKGGGGDVDPPAGGWKTWNANSAAAKALKEGLANEEIDINATPKQVWHSNPLFLQYKLETFRTQDFVLFDTYSPAKPTKIV